MVPWINYQIHSREIFMRVHRTKLDPKNFTLHVFNFDFSFFSLHLLLKKKNNNNRVNQKYSSNGSKLFFISNLINFQKKIDQI